MSAPGWLRRISSPNTDLYSLSQITQCGAIALPSWTVFSGVADTKTGTAITGDTRFNVGSISKCVAAWGVMQLVEQGSVNLDAPIADSLKSWSLPESSFNSDRVTLRRMLSHTAGLSLHGYPGFATATDTPTLKASLAGETNGAGAVHLIAEPGSKWWR
ncbi:serine hydrolase domain-containing protein [Rhodopirellula bahusiensis]|uniref:serine hydrolase domain-containing protein n=1 Tax=Rhodopirellula bahusiensis TaxID=2014065 RepID=UPI0032983DBB